MFCWYVWLDNWKCAPSTPLIHFLASCKKKSPQSLLSLVWFWWIMFAGFRCGLNLNTEMCRAWSPPPKKNPKQSLLPVVSSPKTLCFWAEHPSFLHRTPSVTLLPPLPLSLSLSVLLSGSSESTIAQAPIEKGAYTKGSFSIPLCLH